MKAWLITWDHLGEHVAFDQQIAGILNPRWSPKRVRDVVEGLYAMVSYSAREKLLSAKDRKAAPHPAEFGQTKHGNQFRGLIICGSNPWLRARIVDDLKPDDGLESVEGLSWRERPVPEGIPPAPSLESDGAF